MIRHRTVIAAGLLLVLPFAVVGVGAGEAGGADGSAGTGSAAVDADVPDGALERARSATRALVGDLMGELSAALSQGGPPQAVTVCSEVAQEIQARHGEGGVEVGRTSLRTRNPANRPDAFEHRWLERLEALHAAGELPPEVARVVPVPGDGDGAAQELRYLKPIVIGSDLCLRCHGPRDGLDPEVRRILDERYPDDEATGYAEGDLRGVVTVRVPLAEATASETPPGR